MKISSVKFKLLVWNIAILTIVFSLAQLLVHIVISKTLQHSMDNRLYDISEGPISFIESMFMDDSFEFPIPPNHGDRNFRYDNKRFRMIRMFNANGNELIPPTNSGNISDADIEKPWDMAALNKSTSGEIVYSIVKDTDYLLVRVLSRPILINNKCVAVIQVATSYEELQALKDSLLKIYLLLIPCILIIAGVSGVILTNRALSPVREIVRTAKKINPDDLSQRLPVVGTDEFADLSTTMNGMIAMIETVFNELRHSLERERRFTSDASHEMRTPLTAITANATLSLEDNTTLEEYREAMVAIKSAGDNMKQLIEKLLLLARSDSGQFNLVYHQINMKEVIKESIKICKIDKNHADIYFNISDDAEFIWADKQHLLCVLKNLIENAVRHTPSNGLITINTYTENEMILIKVSDTGEGIPEESLPHIGERFFRVDSARIRQTGGTGLGLAISKSILAAHHGDMMIESKVGEGTSITVKFPLLPM